MDFLENKKIYGIAITGNICTGKTFVSKIIEELGYTVIDADLLSREAVKPQSETLKQLVKHFGEYILDKNGCLNRKVLSEKIFNCKKEKKIVESILHPKIKSLLKNKIKNITDYWFYEASLIYETKQENEFKEVWVTHCSLNEQIRRVAERDKISLDKIKKIMENQYPSNHKMTLADFCINTEKNNEILIKIIKEKIESLDQKKK
ncbi:MAG: dephospho-CoA kinase [Zetaproteobacteria bacterium]|nr:dephospho-CoA kinase [Pseudobdellovibrionaceae bacterium]|tara:strand:- start:38 stop:652 length:615 start_codon:yes stop_codon:yes gene_type:complete